MTDLPASHDFDEDLTDPGFDGTSTWTRLGPFAEDAEAASNDLQSLVHQRLDSLVTNYIDEIGRVPESQRAEPEAHRSVLERYMSTLREDLEESFGQMDDCLKSEVKTRLRLERKARLHRMIHRLGTALLEDRTFRDLSRLVSEECTSLLRCQSTYVFVTDSEGQVLSGGGYQSTRFSSMEILIVPVVQEVLRTRDPKLVDDPAEQISNDLLDLKAGFAQVHNLIAFPIISQEEILGVIVSVNKEGGFSGHDTGILESVASHVGLVFRRFHTQKEVLKTKKFYEDLVSRAGQAIVSVSHGRFTSWNQGAAKIFGYTSGEALTSGLDLIIPDEDRERIASKIEAVGRGDVTFNFECAGIRKDGALLDLQVTLSPLGEDRGIVGIITDLTDRKQMQSQLIQSEKMAAIGQLVGGVAHELNNPLAAILGFAELLADQDVSGTELREELRTIQANAQRCKDTVAKLTRFARRDDAPSDAVDLMQVLRDTIDLREQEMALRNIKIRLVERSRIRPVRGNLIQLQQVFLNLLNNAFDAVAEKMTGGAIEVIVSRQDALALVDFRDTGCGIPKENLSRVFDPFFTTKQNARNTGIGLSVSYRIISNHGGTVQVSSRVGQGTTFRVKLPMDLSTSTIPAAPRAGLEPGEKRLPGRRILVVDDEEDIRRLAERALSMEGAEVWCAGESGEALRLAAENRPELLILDVVLPGSINGLGLHDRLQETLGDDLGQVLFMSGESMNPLVLERVESTSAEFLPKPFGISELIDAARALLPEEAVAAEAS